MSHRIPTIIITSFAILSLGLSTYSNTAPTTPSPVDTATPEPTQSARDAAAAKPDPSFKLLVSQVAGFTLTQVQVHESANSPFPDLENPYYGSDIQVTIGPAGCEAVGIEQLVMESEGTTENENVRVALGTGASSPREHEEYIRRYAEVTSHLGDADALTNIQTRRVSTTDDTTDVVTTMAHHGTVGTKGGVGFPTYLITGNVDDVDVMVRTYPPCEGASTGKEAPPDTAVEVFGAQVKKLKDSSGSTSPSQTPSASSQDASDQDLSSKLINGPMVGFSLAPMKSCSPLAAISNSFYKTSEYEINPDGCDRAGIDNFTTGTEGSLGPVHARVALGTDTSSPQEHRQHVQKCSTITGTVNGEPISESVMLGDAPTIDSVTDVVTASVSSNTPNTNEIGPKSCLITDNVDDVNVVVHLSPLESNQDASYMDAVALFKTQVEKPNS